MLGKLGEDFAVDGDVCEFQFIYELAISGATHARAGVYFYIPKCAHHALFLSAVLKRVNACVQKRLARGALFFAPLPAEALGLF